MPEKGKTLTPHNLYVMFQRHFKITYILIKGIFVKISSFLALNYAITLWIACKRKSFWNININLLLYLRCTHTLSKCIGIVMPCLLRGVWNSAFKIHSLIFPHHFYCIISLLKFRIQDGEHFTKSQHLSWRIFKICFMYVFLQRQMATGSRMFIILFHSKEKKRVSGKKIPRGYALLNVYN